jgi:hypothetical protein
VNKIYRTMKTYGDVEIWRQSFLTLALDGGERPGPLPGRSKTRERALGTHRMGRPQNTSERFGENSLDPARNSIQIPQSSSP